jgi:single-strand DNA-binding protein
MLNTITIQGRLTRNPELRRTGSGKAVTNFALACERDFNEGGEKATDFIECVAWRNTAEFASKYFSKGKMAVVKGRLQIRAYTDKDGNKRTAAEVVVESLYFCGDKSNEPAHESALEMQAEADSAAAEADAVAAEQFSYVEDSGDDWPLPF